jgi:hypothetical protein
MKNVMTPDITLAIAFVAAMAAVALRAAARRPEPRASGAGSAPVALRTPSSPGRPASAAERMQDIFHELHPDGRHAVCTVCDSQYRLA